MFKLVADELAADIKAVQYDFEEYYKFGDKLLVLPFPFVGKPPVPRFIMVPTNER